MTEQRTAIYILSAGVGIVGGAFGMMMFMFELIEAQATLTQKVSDHVEEWHEFRHEHIKQEKECEDERREMLKMIYEIREHLK